MDRLRPSGRTTLVITVAVTVLASIALILRIVSNAMVKKSPALANWFIFSAFACYCAYVAVLLQGIFSSGGTLTLSELTMPQMISLFWYSYIFTALFTSTITLIKISILFFYRSIFTISQFRKASLAVGALCIVWFIVFLFLGLFQCTPVEGFWNLPLVLQGQATCIFYGNFIIAYETTNILLDVALLALPLWAIRTLQLPSLRKFMVAAMFLLGGFVIVICIVRVYYLRDQTTSNAVGLFNGLNWSTVQLAVAIICACMPCYGPLISTKRISQASNRWYATRRSKESSMDNSLKTNSSHSQQLSRYDRLGDTKEEGRYLASARSDFRNPEYHERPYPLDRINFQRTVEVV